MSKRTKAVITISAVAAISGASAAAFAAVGPGQELTPVQAVMQKTQAVPIVQDEIRDHFPLFRNQPANPVPADIAAQIASPDRHGRNGALARSIQTAYGTGWVIPGDGYLCIAVPTTTSGHGVSCVPTKVALERGLWLRLSGSRSDGKALETVVLPDGANAAVKSETGVKTLQASADGVVSEFIDTDGSGPSVVPAG